MKRGISQVVVTVLLVLIVIIAIAIVLIFIRPTIDQGTEDVQDIASNCLALSIEPTRCKFNQTSSGMKAEILVRRNQGTSGLAGLKFVFNGQSAETIDTQETINELETKRFNFSISSQPSTVTVAGLIGADKKSCDARPAISCYQARCGDGETDNFLGEVCDGGCCSSDCRSIPPTCDSLDNDGDGLTDEPGEQSSSQLGIQIFNPLDGTSLIRVDESIPLSSNLTFRILNVSNPQAQIAYSGCWYQLTNLTGRGPVTSIAECANGGVSFSTTIFRLHQISLSQQGPYNLRIYTNDSSNRISWADSTFYLIDSLLRITSPFSIDHQRFMTNTSNVPLTFEFNTGFNPSSCNYTLTNLTRGANQALFLSQNQPSSQLQQANLAQFTGNAQGRFRVDLACHATSGDARDTITFVVSQCPGNVNALPGVDGSDLSVFGGNYQACSNDFTRCLEPRLDLDFDNDVDGFDFAILLLRFGSTC